MLLAYSTFLTNHSENNHNAIKDKKEHSTVMEKGGSYFISYDTFDFPWAVTNFTAVTNYHIY